MPELRQDPLTDTWVIIASERSKRPSDFASKKEGKGFGQLPILPGKRTHDPTGNPCL